MVAKLVFTDDGAFKFHEDFSADQVQGQILHVLHEVLEFVFQDVVCFEELLKKLIGDVIHQALLRGLLLFALFVGYPSTLMSKPLCSKRNSKC